MSQDNKVKPAPVFADRKQCRKIAGIIANLNFRPSFYKRKFITFRADAETKVRVYLYSLAICHQTQTLKSEKLKKAGWDYLECIFINLAKSKSQYLNPYNLVKKTPNLLASKLGELFSDTGRAKDSTLDCRVVRAEMLIDVANVLVKKYKGEVTNMLQQSNGYLENNGHGLYDLLAEMKAYSNDRVRKKAGGFIKFLDEAKLYKVKDWQHYYPMMDYHMQRVLLRMGCVVIEDINLRNKIVNREKLKSDRDIRLACVKAIKLISNLSGIKISKMNDIFYPLGRSYCTETTLCRDHVVDELRMNFDKVISLSNYLHCPFEKVCKASYNDSYVQFWQPVVETSSY
jgi:hypothetical protein